MELLSIGRKFKENLNGDSEERRTSEAIEHLISNGHQLRITKAKIGVRVEIQIHPGPNVKHYYGYSSKLSSAFESALLNCVSEIG